MKAWCHLFSIRDSLVRNGQHRRAAEQLLGDMEKMEKELKWSKIICLVSLWGFACCAQLVCNCPFEFPVP